MTNIALSLTSITSLSPLYLDQLRRRSGKWESADYWTLVVSSEATNYTLKVSGYVPTSDAADGLRSQSGMQFSTYDADNDMQPSINCAFVYGGGRLVVQQFPLLHAAER